MTVSPGKSFEARHKGATHRHVMLVGPEAVPLRSAVEKLGAERMWHFESIMEAVLGDDSVEENKDSGLILAGVSQEINEIEPAVRSLRKVYPHWRIVLLCDPGDEVVCRKAKGWGANDYILLPVDGESLREALSVHPAQPSVRPAPAEMVREPVTAHAAPVVPQQHVETKPKRVETPAQREIVAPRHEEPRKAQTTATESGVGNGGGLVNLPLIVQTVLLNDLMGGRADFADRAVATLQAYIPFGGRMRFVPAEANGSVPASDDAKEIREMVFAQQQPPFGALALEVADDAHAVSVKVMLSQAAQWLGGMLSLARRYEQLRSLAITDELSGAYNRRYFMKWMSGLLERAAAKRFRVTLMMFDIDDFKQYNDRFGHASGDAIIRELIKLLRGCSRSHDLVARLGGDEFAVVYWDNEAPRQPNSEHPKDVLVATERFRRAIHEHHWADSCKINGEVSISGGLATFPRDSETLEGLMEKADEALLRAKSTGKNVIVMHGKAGEAECAGGE